MDEIRGFTPKEKYDNLIKIQQENIELSVKIESCRVFFEAIKDNPALENIKSFIPKL